MHLWDIVGRFIDSPGPMYGKISMAAMIPNGNPLPDTRSKYTHWVRLETAISGDEAQHLLNTKYASETQAKC